VNGIGGISGSGTFTEPPQIGHRLLVPAFVSDAMSNVLHRGHLISIVIGVPISRDGNNFIMGPAAVQEHSGRIRNALRRNRLVIGGGDFGIFFFLRLTSVYYMIYL
jgi:hypothetical protein